MASPGALGLPTYLFEIVQAVLVTVGDVEGVEVLQGTSLIRQSHSGDAFQDLIQLLLTRGLKRAQKAENKTKKVRAMGPFNVNTLDSGNTSRDEHLCALPHDTGLPLGSAADFTCRHPKSERCTSAHADVWRSTQGDMHISHAPHMAKSQHDTRSQALEAQRRRSLRDAPMGPTGGDK